MRRAGKRRIGRRGGLLAVGAAAGLAIGLAACGPAGSNSAGSVGTTPTSGGLATYATLPGLPAQYIFPFDSSTYFTATDSNDFQYLLYRPLYWFGDGTTPYLNPKISLAYLPKYSHQTVTITLKHNLWSDGAPVTAENVMFWINMTKAEDTPALAAAGRSIWAGYIPGYFPDNVSSFRVIGNYKIEMTIKGPYSETWFTDNELSQITPMPTAWDETAPGRRTDCEQDVADCGAVYKFLSSRAADPSTWSGAPWNVVDGPWQVVSTGQGNVTMKYNTKYTGPRAAHHIGEFELESFTSEQAEYNQLEDPGRSPVDVGYLPTVDAPAPPPGAQVGSNPASLTGYKLTVIYPWALSYFPYNFDSSAAGPIFHQLYFRQALQSLVDQEGVVSGPMHGYGTVTIGPVADYPVTSSLSPELAAKGDMWPLNPAKAESLLKSNGWSVSTSGGTDTCIHAGTGPGECGANVRAGTPLKLTLIYAAGLDWMESEVKALISNASLVGINITATALPTTTVVGDVFGGSTSWELADWGSWTYAPDYLPTGEELFQTTSVANGGHYNDPVNNADITATIQARTPQQFQTAMDNWQQYLAPRLPVVYQPNVATLDESVSDLFIGPQSPTLNLTPEDWYYLK
jgi:peptide/nickel transport system substrate-binding protein